MTGQTLAVEDWRAKYDQAWAAKLETYGRMDKAMADEAIIAQLDQGEARTLRLEAGERFIGTYVGLRRASATWKGKERPCWVLQLADDNGELAEVWLLSKVLLSKLRMLAPKVGERVGIKALGKVPSKSGADYHDWRVAVARAAVGWQEVSEDEAPDE